MGKLEDFLSGTRILKEVDSPVNGHIVVKTDLAWGTHIQAGGLTQSGGVVESVWKSTFKELKELRTEKIKDVLILGLGGGTIAKLVRGNFPDAKIVSAIIHVPAGWRRPSVDPSVRAISPVPPLAFPDTAATAPSHCAGAPPPAQGAE